MSECKTEKRNSQCEHRQPLEQTRGLVLVQGRGLRRETGLSPPVKYFTDRSKAVLLLWIICFIYVLCLSSLCVCSLLPYGHLLGKGWPLCSRLWCLIVFLSLSHVVSWVRCGTWLNRFLIFAAFYTLFCTCDSGSLSINHNTSVTSGEWVRFSTRIARESELGSWQSNVCHTRGYERWQKSKDSLKACFENVNIYLCTIWLFGYNAFNVYRRELAPGTVSLTGDRAQGDDIKHLAYSTVKAAPHECVIRTGQP